MTLPRTLALLVASSFVVWTSVRLLRVSSLLSTYLPTPIENEHDRAQQYLQQAKKNVTRIEKLTEELETISERYFVYDNPNLTLMELRSRAMDGVSKTIWRHKWGERFKTYSQGEIRFLRALEDHPLRTKNVSEASFILVPIPIGATFFWRSKKQHGRVDAFRHLLENEELFQKFPEKHVLLTLTERLFLSYWGLNKNQLEQLRPVTVAKDSLVQIWPKYKCTSAAHRGGWVRRRKKACGCGVCDGVNHSFSLGWSHEASVPTYGYEQASLDAWKNKTFHFFYHTKHGTSLFNSTQYRHALVDDPKVAKTLIQPSSVGFDIPGDQWVREFSNSKFCLTIRGDTPGSRSMFRSIRAGCMPLIVSDALPYYTPFFRSILKLEDYAVVVGDKEFLQNPSQAINNATSALLSNEEELEKKIAGLALVQRILVLDHQDPLFVPSFVRETLASQRKEYYDLNYSTLLGTTVA